MRLSACQSFKAIYTCPVLQHDLSPGYVTNLTAGGGAVFFFVIRRGMSMLREA